MIGKISVVLVPSFFYTYSLRGSEWVDGVELKYVLSSRNLKVEKNWNGVYVNGAFFKEISENHKIFNGDTVTVVLPLKTARK